MNLIKNAILMLALGFSMARGGALRAPAPVEPAAPVEEAYTPDPGPTPANGCSGVNCVTCHTGGCHGNPICLEICRECCG
jgi:hypothetical protein